MKIIGLEEHFVTADVRGAWLALSREKQDSAMKSSCEGAGSGRMPDIGAERVEAMPDTGVGFQVLPLATPGVQSLQADEAVALQTDCKDRLAETVPSNPERFQGFAALATPVPAKAARELERAVTQLGLNGAMLFRRTRERNLDHPDLWPIFEAAAARKALLLTPVADPRRANCLLQRFRRRDGRGTDYLD